MTNLQADEPAEDASLGLVRVSPLPYAPQVANLITPVGGKAIIDAAGAGGYIRSTMPQGLRPFHSTFAMAGLLLLNLLGGCSLLRTATGTKGRLTVAPQIEPLANNNSPIAVDIVTVTDKKTLEEVSKFTAQMWFSQKQDYRRMHPNLLQIVSREWVPGEVAPPIRVADTKVAAGVLLFANYSTPGPHAAVLPSSGTIRIDFGLTDFALPSPK